MKVYRAFLVLLRCVSFFPPAVQYISGNKKKPFFLKTTRAALIQTFMKERGGRKNGPLPAGSSLLRPAKGLFF
ncbi:MAG: hypothetical protein CSA76_06510 [Spirochaetales bacterium]|nr:MAG: hypothetical protein CSA76_06510 [Spirochaetales bacterium]